MAGRRLRRVGQWAAAAAIAALWWWPVVDYLDSPAYRIDLAYIVVVILAGAMHVAALVQYQGMTRIAKHGGVDPITRIYAFTQRIRYVFRAGESALALGIGVLGLISYRHPAILRNPNYAKYVLTYFFGTILITAYLTYRDWLVIRAIKTEEQARA